MGRLSCNNLTIDELLSKQIYPFITPAPSYYRGWGGEAPANIYLQIFNEITTTAAAEDDRHTETEIQTRNYPK